MEDYKLIRRSLFSNAYGILELVQINGTYYIQFDDWYGPCYFGPLEQQHIDAFHLLCELPANVQV